MSLTSERLKIARQRKGLKQTQVKEKTGINNKTLSGYENNVAEPDLKTLKTLAELYEVSVEWLIGNTDSSRGFTEEEQQALDNMKKAVPLKQIAQEHDIDWDGKILDEREKLSLLSFMVSIMKLRDEKK
jgi:transcriptional regulator with XRE-family HTH domain